jgi:hypothetical protein
MKGTNRLSTWWLAFLCPQVRMSALNGLVVLCQLVPREARVGHLLPLVRRHMQPLELELPLQRTLAAAFPRLLAAVSRPAGCTLLLLRCYRCCCCCGGGALDAGSALLREQQEQQNTRCGILTTHSSCGPAGPSIFSRTRLPDYNNFACQGLLFGTSNDK